VAVIVVGEHQARSGEAASISTLDLPAGQREMIQAAHDSGLKIVLVVLAGRPLALTREVALADAVLYAWQPGVEGGNAIADLLFGQAVPGGKAARLAAALGWPGADLLQPQELWQALSPAARFDRLYRPAQHTAVPFGYGLSYTSFHYHDLQVHTPSFRPVWPGRVQRRDHQQRVRSPAAKSFNCMCATWLARLPARSKS
jgi:beta-glucosidase